MQFPLLEDALNDMAVIRTTLETLELFPADDPIRPEILAIAFDARENLIARFRELCVGLHTTPSPYRMDFERF